MCHGERDRWRTRAAALAHGRENPDRVRLVGATRPADLTGPQVAWLPAEGPEAAARTWLAAVPQVRNRQRIDLGADLPRWSEIVGDDEMPQPFPQVARPAVILTGAQRAAPGLPGTATMPGARIVPPLNRPWRSNGLDQRRTQLAHAVPGTLTLVAEIDPGMPTWNPGPTAAQRVTEIRLDDA